MNLVGKIFTALVFLMAVVFGSFSVAVHLTHPNWRDDVVRPVSGLDVKLNNAKKLTEELASRKNLLADQIKAEATRHQDVLIRLEVERVALLKEKDANAQKISQLQASIRDTTKAIFEFHQTLETLHKKADATRAEIKAAQAERDRLFKQAVDLTDRLNIAVNERMRLEKTYNNLTAQLYKGA